MKWVLCALALVGIPVSLLLTRSTAAVIVIARASPGRASRSGRRRPPSWRPPRSTRDVRRRPGSWPSAR